MAANDPTPTPDPTPVPDPTPPTPPEPDELGKLRAQNAAQARDLALAQARLEFPKADAEILGKFQGTVDDMRAFAKSLHDREAARPVTTPAVPTPGPGNSTTAEDQAIARYRELRYKVITARSAEPWERDEFETLSFNKMWNQHAADRKAMKSSTEGVQR